MKHSAVLTKTRNVDYTKLLNGTTYHINSFLFDSMVESNCQLEVERCPVPSTEVFSFYINMSQVNKFTFSQ